MLVAKEEFLCGQLEGELGSALFVVIHSLELDLKMQLLICSCLAPNHVGALGLELDLERPPPVLLEHVLVQYWFLKRIPAYQN